MRIQAYTAYSGVLVASIATIRPQAQASVFFQSATIHEDWAARVRAALKEHKHILGTALNYPASARLQTYFPASASNPYYALRQLMPSGSPRDVDQEFMLEVTRLRYDFTLDLLPAAFLATEPAADALERAMEYAAFRVLGYLDIPNAHIPGDKAVMPPEGSYVNIVCELGPASARTGVDIPAPS